MEIFGLLIFIFIMYSVMKEVFKKLGFAFFTKSEQTMHALNPFAQILKILLRGWKSDGMMSGLEQSKLFSYSNRGLLIDGMSKRLSLKDSFNHLALISRTGGGKTTSYVIPNMFKLADDNCSMVITDISGELYNQTSGYMAKKGFKIYVLNPEDLNESIGYNPLYYATDSMKIDELCTLLVKSSKEAQRVNSSDEFWDSGAKSLISILIKVLMATGNHKHINLANVRYLINNYGADGRALDGLVDNFADDKTYHEFRGFIKGNPQTILSMVSTANIALSAIGINDNLEKLTSHHTINFDNFRREKSIIYIKVPGQKQRQYSFLLNIFYHQFFSFMMEKLPTKKDLPIFCLLDEFGNMNLPNFENTITTIRKYNVSTSIILQDINQIENRYGKANAQTILNGGIASKLFFSGADLPTTEMLSRILGIKEEIRTDMEGNFYFKDEAVMKSNDIRTMKDDEALFITSNKLPVKIKIKPYYKDFIFNSYAKIKPFVTHKNMDLSVEYIDLDFGDDENE